MPLIKVSQWEEVGSEEGVFVMGDDVGSPQKKIPLLSSS